MSRLETAINAYELCSRVLAASDWDTAALIELAGGSETNWLEFKAACCPTIEHALKPGESEGDLKWNVAKACIAMANTDGGCLLLGVDDRGQPVGLGPSDPKGMIQGDGIDAFIRHLDAYVVLPQRGWSGQKSGSIEVEGGVPEGTLEYRVCQLGTARVLAVLVRPVVAAGPCLHCSETIQHRLRFVLLVRKSGTVGQVVELVMPREITAWERDRQPTKSDYATLLQKFVAARQDASVTGEPRGLEDRIAAYHAQLTTKLRDVERGFTSLDAEERTDLEVGNASYQPWAEEHLEPDFDWDKAAARDTGLANDSDDPDDLSSGEELDENDDQSEQDEADDSDGEGTRIARRGRVFELLAQERRAILLGDPGAGKTTCLRRLALRHASTYEPGGRVAIFVPLSRYQRPADLMPLLVRSMLFRDTSLTEADLLWLIQSGRLLLLLDAFNECPDAFRADCGAEIERLLVDHPDLSAVISARSIGWSQRIRLPAFTLQPMNQAQRVDFLLKCLGDKAQAAVLIEHLCTWGEQRMDLGSPMLLRMAATVFSQDGALPSGQALLYRRIVAIWYARESKKALDAGGELPWDLATVMEALAALAFDGRARGQRIMPRKAVVHVLGTFVVKLEEFLDTLGQGFLLHATEEVVEFGHESYQEYFAAEHCMKHPEAGAELRLDKTTWGMVLVHAAQLGSLPPALADVAWKLDPWLGAALDSRDTIPDSVRKVTETWSVEDRAVLEFMTTGAPTDAPIPRSEKKARNSYDATDPVLKAAVFSLPCARQRWEAHEARLFRNGVPVSEAVAWLPRLLVPPATLPCKARWIASASPELAAKWATSSLWGLTVQDFEPRKTRWITKVSPWQAALLVATGICTAQDFEPRKARWITQASPDTAILLVGAGICTFQELGPRKAKWIEQGSPELAVKLVVWQCLGSTAQDLEPCKAEWIDQASPGQAARLVRLGISTIQDFTLRKAKWIANAEPWQATKLVTWPLWGCTAQDFEHRKLEWGAQANEKEKSLLIKAGIMTPKEFAVTRQSSSLAEDASSSIAHSILSTHSPMQPDSPHQSAPITNSENPATGTFPTQSTLTDSKLRAEVETRLQEHIFSGTVINVRYSTFAFVQTNSIPDNVFCHNSVWPEDSSLMVPGRKVEFEAGLRFNDKKSVWNYVVTNLRVLDTDSLPESVESASYEKSSARKPPDGYMAPTASPKGDDAIQSTQQQLGSPSASSPLVQAETKTAFRTHQPLHPTSSPRPKYKPTFLQPAAKRLQGDPFGHLKSIVFCNEKKTDLVIYIDEAWPEEGADAEFGVLAGVVWMGSEPDPAILPIPPQHLREQAGFHEKALGYLNRLDACPNAIPFIFRFKPPGKFSPKETYEQMVHEGLLILLGWLLPGQAPTLKQPTGVRVVCEAIGADHRDGQDQTDIFRGILAQAARRDPARFSRWVLTELVWVQKSGADPANFSPREILYQGYMAYGDLLGYMTVGAQSPKALRLAREVRLDQFPNFLNISSGLANTLEMIHQAGPASPGVFLDQMAANLESPFIRGILDELRKRWETDTDTKLKLYSELDARYMQKVRDLRGLARQFAVVQRVCGPLPPDASRRLRLMEIGIQLQRANHFGDPASLGALEQAYQELRSRALENGEADLVAHVDLNLAVRASDRFEPEQAKLIVEDLLKEEPRLSLLSRSRAHSALGQYLSMAADYETARREFDLALDIISKADLSESERLGDSDQTAIYRAFNSVDAGSPDAIELVKAIIKTSGVGLGRDHQFRHHLWVRYLDSRDELALERKTYMESASDDLLDTHPWQLIAMYRGLFASELERYDDAVRWFDKAIEIALGSLHGPTLRMIAAVIATVAWLETEEPAFKEAAQGIMDGEWKDLVPPQPLTEILPTVSGKVDTLRKLIAQKDPADDNIDQALGLLAFNYR